MNMQRRNVKIAAAHELERMQMANSPRLQEILTAARKRIAAGEGIPEDEFWAKVNAETKKRTRRKKIA
jgi:hypothetical protein